MPTQTPCLASGYDKVRQLELKVKDPKGCLRSDCRPAHCNECGECEQWLHVSLVQLGSLIPRCIQSISSMFSPPS